MVRSPFFIVLLFFSVYSCRKSTNNEINLKTEKSKNQNSVRARQFLDIGDRYYSIQNFDSAFYYYNASRTKYELEKDSANIAYNSLQMADIQQKFGDYFGSEESIIDVLPYIKKGSVYESSAYNLLGISSKELYNNEDAIYYYEKTKNTTIDSLGILSVENNKATVYIQKKEYQISIKILQNILKSKILDTLKKKKARYLDNLGYCYFKMKQNSKGFGLMNSAMIIREKNKDPYGSIESYLHLAEFYQNKNIKKSEEYALKAYQVSSIINSIDERLESLSFLISNYFEKNNSYAVIYLHLNDSIKKVRNRAKNQFAKIKYETKQNRAENLKLRNRNVETDLQLEKQKNRTNISIFGFVTLLGSVFYITNYYKNRNKRERLEETYNTETRISKKLHDELANDVYLTMTFAETQDLSSNENKEVLLHNLDTIYSLTRNISKENSSIDTGIAFLFHLKGIISDFNTKEVNIMTNSIDTIDWASLESNKKIVIYRVIQELLINMKKHSQCSLVVISFKITDKKIQINYIDDGIGATSDRINLKNGLKNVENRILAIKGSITFDTEINKGFKVNLKFPI
jgi:two-component sensor histidine kinase